MAKPPRPDDEEARLAELRSLELLDTEPEPRFDQVTRLAQRLFSVPVAEVTLLDEDRAWVKSIQGIDDPASSRDDSFCAWAILQPDVMHVPDATADDRFRDNPYVNTEPGVRMYAGAPIHGPGGARLGALCIIDIEPRDLSAADLASLRDLADLVEQEIAVRHLATVDELTGVANRRGFEMHARKSLEVCRRLGSDATLVYFDLDEFKAINDRYGHREGDRLLVEFAELLQRTLRTSDVIGRLGGDEFAALLSDATGPSEAAARVHKALDERNRTYESSHPLAASIGATRFDHDGHDTLETLMQRADAAMFAAKRARH